MKRTAIVTDHGIVFLRDQNVGGTYAADAACLRKILPVLVDAHKPGDAVIGGTVHHFVDNIGTCRVVVGQSLDFVVDHDGNRTLHFQILIDGKPCKLAQILALRNRERRAKILLGSFV